MYTLKDIAIVIVNWNGKSLLEQFLPAVIEHSKNAQIFLADNASTDDSVDFVAQHFSDVTIIQNKDNGGYAKGYNLALKEIDAPILCLLNSDVEVTEHWLKPILSEFNSENIPAIIQPKILDHRTRTYFDYAGAAGGYIDKLGYPYCRGRIFNTIEKDDGQYNDVSDIFWASGACFFIKNDVFKNLNGFDERYFAHMEEIDLCWRAFNNNYNVKYVGTSTVFHVGGATLSSTNPKKTYLNFRNSLFTLAKNTDKHLMSRILTRMILDGLAALRFLIQLKPRHFMAIFKAHLSFYQNLNAILKQRRTLPKKTGYFKKTSIVWSYFVKGNKTF